MLLPLLVFVLLAPATLAQDRFEMVPMRDGVELATDIFLPEGDGPWPTILFRTPYGRDEYTDTAESLTSYGVAVVSQDMRGRFESEGVDMETIPDGTGDLLDGNDTCAWGSPRGATFSSGPMKLRKNRK